jgi:putative DNA primase/helicase
MACNGALMIPMSFNRKITSLQFINKESEKRFLPDGEKGGYLIGKLDAGKPVCICEGLATGASIHEATGYPVFVAFDAGNMKKMAAALQAKNPAIQIILCADDDESGTGQRKALEAAQLVNGLVAMPVFSEPRLEGVKDFNDMATLQGLDTVKLAIESAQSVRNEVRTETGDLNGLNNPVDTSTPPEPLPALPDVLSFNYAYLPDGLRGFVKDISERMQCPPDFAAVAVFVMMGTIIGRKVGIRPMKHNDWTVICNLWGAVVGNSGVMKSPTLSAALSPVKKLQAAAFEIFNMQMVDHESQIEVAKLLEGLGKNEAKKKLKGNKNADVKSLLKTDTSSDKPILKRYLTNNASYEALGELLIENPNGLLVESDEIIGLLKQLDAGGQEVARSFYLTAADGDKPYTFDRIMRGKGLHIEALCLSIIGGIQPGVLAEYVRQATGGGAGADGLLQRFGLMVYPDISPDWKEVDRYPDGEIRQAVNQLAERLDKLTAFGIGAETDQFGGVPFLRFDEAAQGLFSEWRLTLETRLRSGEEHPAIVSHLSKYRKLIPSLALINHLCDTQQGAVSEKSLMRAIAFGEYLESHARRIYSYATRPDIDAAKTLLKRLASGKLSSPFTGRDIYRAGWAGLENPSKAQSAINLLMEYHHLKEEEITTGGRPATHYHWVKAGAV